MRAYKGFLVQELGIVATSREASKGGWDVMMCFFPNISTRWVDGMCLVGSIRDVHIVLPTLLWVLVNPTNQVWQFGMDRIYIVLSGSRLGIAKIVIWNFRIRVQVQNDVRSQNGDSFFLVKWNSKPSKLCYLVTYIGGREGGLSHMNEHLIHPILKLYFV